MTASRAPEALRCARAPDGAAHWLWRSGDDFLDLGQVERPSGIAPLERARDLGELASLFLDEGRRIAELAQAPLVDAANWPLLLPGRPGKGLALGKSFAAHAREFGSEPPEELVWFAKLPEVLIGPGEPVRIPAWLTTRVDPEAEVVVLLGRPLANAAPEEAAAAIAAYTLGNDVTARKQQGEDRKRGWPWVRCKNLATFGPMGPEWVPAAAIDLPSLTLRGLVNDEVRQEASMGDLIWSPDRALAEISRWCPLRAGDVVFLGTPAGVTPIAAGDLVAVEAEGLGRLENPVVAGA